MGLILYNKDDLRINFYVSLAEIGTFSYNLFENQNRACLMQYLNSNSFQCVLENVLFDFCENG